MRILNFLSFYTGKLSKLYIPISWRRPLYSLFACAYKLNLAEVEYDLSFYNSFSEFFTRNLKVGLRPIESALVSPADSLFIDAGKIDEQRLIGVKGCSYSVRELLGEPTLAKYFISGAFYNFYLAPGDYHHVHSPVSGEILARVHIPGSLYPVSKFFVKFFSDLYIKQERVVTLIKDLNGNYHAVIMVGAYNVGSIGLKYEQKFLSNQLDSSLEVSLKEYNNLTINVGERLGTFYIGSTVVFLSNISFDLNKLTNSIGSKVKYGQQLVQDL